MVEFDGRRWRGDVTRDADLRRLAAADVEDELGGELQARDHEAGVDAAGEAVLSVGSDAERAPGLSRADRIEVGALDEHIGGGFADLGRLAAHDAAEAD